MSSFTSSCIDLIKVFIFTIVLMGKDAYLWWSFLRVFFYIIVTVLQGYLALYSSCLNSINGFKFWLFYNMASQQTSSTGSSTGSWSRQLIVLLLIAYVVGNLHWQHPERLRTQGDDFKDAITLEAELWLLSMVWWRSMQERQEVKLWLKQNNKQLSEGNDDWDRR